MKNLLACVCQNLHSGKEFDLGKWEEEMEDIPSAPATVSYRGVPPTGDEEGTLLDKLKKGKVSSSDIQTVNKTNVELEPTIELGAQSTSSLGDKSLPTSGFHSYSTTAHSQYHCCRC